MAPFQKYALILLLCGSVLLINPWLTTEVFEFPKFLLLLGGVEFLTLLTLIDWYQSSQKIFPEIWRKNRYFFIFLSLFVVGHILAYLFSTNRQISLAGAKDRFQGFLTSIHYFLLTLNTLYFFARSEARREDIFRTFLRWLLITGGIIALLALLPYVFPFTFPFYLFTPSFFFDRVFSTFGNPNYLAVFLIAILPFLVLQKRLFPKSIMWLLLALTLLTLFFTGSRSAWLASLTTFFLAGILSAVHRKRYRMLLITVTIIGLLVFIAQIKERFTPSLPQLSRLALDTPTSTSLQTRLHLWKAGLAIALKRPLTGYGQDMIQKNIESFVPPYLRANEVFFIDRTHSEFIDVLVSTGFFGFLGYLGILVMVLRKGFQKFSYSPAFLSFLSLTLFHAVNFSTISSNVLWYFLIGYLMVLRRKQKARLPL